MRLTTRFLLPLSALLISLPLQAATCVTNGGNCAKFDIPGDFPGDFYIDFQAVDFSWKALSGGFVQGSGQLSSASEIHFHVGDAMTGEPGRYAISAAPDGFEFVGLQYDYNGLRNADFYAVGTGQGWFDSQTGDWDMVVPFMLKLPDFLAYYLGDLHLSTQNAGGAPMILDSSNADWGKLTIASNGPISAATGVDQVLLNQLLTPGYVDTSYENLELNFTIEGYDPVAAVPLPSSGWMFASAAVFLLGTGRKR